MYQLDDLLHLMARLRDPQHGCPWDLKQNYATIVPYTLEEAYEVADAIERGDFEHLPGELGDLLFQVVYYSQLAQEEGLDMAEVAALGGIEWAAVEAAADTLAELLAHQHTARAASSRGAA